VADELSELEATRERNRDAWAALRMMREAVETYMPPGALPDYNAMGPSILDEGEALAKAIGIIATRKSS
jgi:hypothetical protein